MKLVEWLTAILDEAEQVALAADHQVGNLVGDPRDCTPWDALAEDFERRQISWSEAVADHVELHSPAAVLADIAAKRALLDDIFAYEAKIDGEWGDCCSAQNIRDGLCEYTPVDEIRAVGLLASAYAHRPGYRQEWAPDA